MRKKGGRVLPLAKKGCLSSSSFEEEEEYKALCV